MSTTIIAFCKPPIYQISCQFLAVHVGMQFQQHPIAALLTGHQTVPTKFNSIILPLQSQQKLSDSKLLFIPHVRTCFGSRSFAVADPTIWNSLPLAIRSSVSTHSFWRQLKTLFYNLAFRPS